MKLTFWLAEQHQDNQCYNLIAKTRKELLALIDENDHVEYEPPVKVTITYADGFDLFSMVTGESGGRGPNYR